MARSDALLDEGRAGGQAQGGLGDVGVGTGLEALAEGLDLGRRGGRPDEHAVAAGALGFLDHQLGQVGEDVGQLLRLAALPGGHVAQDGLLVEIEADHVADIGVHRLVVGDAGADGVGQHHIAGAVRRQQARHAEHGLGVEGQGVEEGVVQATVDHVHRLRAGGGAHEHAVVTHEQVGPLHQLDAHLACQEGVLEVGAVEAAWGEHHHAGVVQRAGALERFQQQVRVVVDGGDALGGEQLGEQPHHHLAVFEHVAHAAGGAQVVFQHVVGAVAVAHQVDPGDVGVDVAVQVQALHGDLVALVGQHLLGGDDPGLDDALLVVEVGEEQVQRLDALDAAALDHAPFAHGDGAGDGVEGNQALGALLVPIEGEGDTGPVEQQVGFAPPLGKQFFGGFGQPAGELPVVRTAIAARVVHLVIKGAGHAGLLVATDHRAVASAVPATKILPDQAVATRLKIHCTTAVQPWERIGTPRPVWRRLEARTVGIAAAFRLFARQKGV